MRAWELVRDAVGLPRLRHRLQHRGPPLARPGLPPGAAPQPRRQQVLDVRRGPLHLQARADRAPGRRRCRAACRSTGTARSTTRRKRAARACSTRRPTQVGVVFNAQSTNEDLYALARLAFDHLRVGKAYIAGLRPGLAATTSWCRADMNPNTAGAMAIGAGRLRSLLDLAERPEGGRGHGAARASATRRRARRRRRARGAAARRLQALVAIGDARGRGRRGRARRAAAGRVGRGRRHVHQPPGHGPAHARRRRRPRATRCPAGRSCRTWRASWAPRWSSSRRRRCSPRPSRSCRS